MDADFVKKFSSRYKEKDDYFGASEVENILQSNYMEMVSKFDIKVVA